MKYLIAQIAGVALFVFGLQGVIRLVVSASDPGILTWLPGGADLKIAAYVIIAVAGGTLASRATKKPKARTK